MYNFQDFVIEIGIKNYYKIKAIEFKLNLKFYPNLNIRFGIKRLTY